jgi:class 3 adenylate cyclase/predicted ATPase
MDVGAWLYGLGLSQYEQVFRDNAVDEEVLPELGEADLEKLGVLLGHRKKLLKAIAVLPGGAASTRGGEARSPSPPPSEGRNAQAERRQLTVMFVDLVGSTALAARLDPEEMQDLLRAYQDVVAGAIGRFEGHLAKFMGDGVLAYFGWPIAHEDEAERAVRAGRAAVEAVARLRAPDDAPLAARVGIATGLVVVGDLVGSEEARERAVTGGTPNLAARLQALTSPNRVVIAEATRHLLGGLFEVEDLGLQAVKGFDAPVRAFRVGAERGDVGRFEARHAAGHLTPMVGREQELALLLERWRQAAAGEGQAVLLVGEAGIGKSRLVRAVLDTGEGEARTVLRYHCSPLHTGTALWPVMQQLTFAAGFGPADADAAKLDKLEVLLRQGMEDVSTAASLVAALLGIDAGARFGLAPDLDPQQRRARTLAVLVEQLLALAHSRPVLMVVEDTHWIDPTTFELMNLVLDRITGARVLALLTSRPENQPALGSYQHVTQLTLNRLGRGPTEAIVTRLAGGRSLPQEVLGAIAARTDGIPLFVEELTKAVLEAETAGAASAVPTSLHDTLMARLDRVPGVKEVAQIGACIGREFPHTLLAAVAPLGAAELVQALDQLGRAELVFRRGTPPEAAYSFKHALVRDAAYQSLLKSRRQQLHATIATALEQHFPETATTEPEVLARHCSEGGLVEKAVGYWHQAGQLAIRRSAMAEAVPHLRAGLGMLVALPDGVARARKELELQFNLGHALMALKGVASPEMGSAYQRAHELTAKLGDITLEPAVLFGLWMFHQNRADLARAGQAGAELLRGTGWREDVAAEVVGHRTTGSVQLFQGNFAAALRHFDQVLARYAPAQRYVAEHLTDHRLGVQSVSTWALLATGHPDRAYARSREVLARAEQARHAYDLAIVMHQQNVLDVLRHDRESVEERTAALMALTAEHGFAHWHATATILHGWALATRDGLDAGIGKMRQGLAAKKATGARLKIPFYLGLMAGLYGRAGRSEEALDLVGNALARIEATGERWFEAELHRIRGELLLSSGTAKADVAEVSLRKAIEVARDQSAKWWELRAASSLARLWAERGEHRQAHDLLASVYGWFTEGFDMPDLQGARALLARLR